ncbi:hypothetical protein TNCV_1034161 [Trichonephila clavipes]|nr:hypothetical protein TNCV_1034161 [Trichonephila clavipes]
MYLLCRQNWSKTGLRVEKWKNDHRVFDIMLWLITLCLQQKLELHTMDCMLTLRTVTDRLLQAHTVQNLVVPCNHTACSMHFTDSKPLPFVTQWYHTKAHWRTERKYFVFSDENWFCLRFSDGHVLVRRKLGGYVQPTCLQT